MYGVDRLVTGIAAAVGVFFWPVVIILIIVLLVHHGSKDPKHHPEDDEPVAIAEGEELQAKVVKPEPAPVAPPKPKNPYAGINAMLLTGSALLVVAVIKFTNDANDSLVAPVAIILTLLFYTIGYFLYKKVDYLKIVGTAFSYISLAIFPFWVISFNFFGMSWHGAWILSSIITFAALILTSFIYKSKIPAYFAYIWLFVIAWACTPEGAIANSNFNIQVYWLYTTSAIVALIPAILWKLKPDWLPVFFRKPTQVFGAAFMPTVAVFSVWLYVVPDSLNYFPFLRTIMISLFLIWSYLYYTITRSYGWFVFLRFVAQGILLTITMDALNYSLFSSESTGVNDSVKLAIITVWLISFLAQTMASLFIPKKDAAAEKFEHFAEVISLLGIFVTPLLTIGLKDPVGPVVNLIICFVIAVLGVSYTIVHKNPRWSMASAIALCLARIVITNSVLIASWNAWSDLIYFTVVAGLIMLMYQMFRKYNEQESFAITIVELIVVSVLIVWSALNANYAEIGWLIVSLYLALLGYMSNQAFLYEMSIYSGAFCLYSLSGTIGELMLPESASKCVTGAFSFITPCSGYELSAYTNWIAGINTVRSLIVGGALLAVSFLKERQLEQNKRWRFFLGYLLAGLGLYAVGITAGDYWMMFCLVWQVIFLVYAAINDIEWLVWVTIIAMPICALSLTGGFTYLWFAILGLTLIGIVIWRLAKMNHAKLAAEANAQKPKADAEKK